MKKKMLILVSLMMFITLLAIPALADDTFAPPAVIMDGQALNFNVPPMIENGRTLVPLRAIFEAMGAAVSWNDATKTASAVKGETTVVLAIASVEATINGELIKLDVPAKIVDSRTLAPLRFVGEAFGGTVNWDGTTRTITIYSNGTVSEQNAAEPAAAISTAAELIKASIAAFVPVTAEMDFKGNIDAMGGIDYTAKGAANIAADKTANCSYESVLGPLGTSNPTIDVCPFGEFIAGSEADALALIEGAILTEEGDNYVLTVTGGKCAASLQSIFDNASDKVTFEITTDYILKFNKTTYQLISAELIKAEGIGKTMLGDLVTTASGTVIYSY